MTESPQTSPPGGSRLGGGQGATQGRGAGAGGGSGGRAAGVPNHLSRCRCRCRCRGGKAGSPVEPGIMGHPPGWSVAAWEETVCVPLVHMSTRPSSHGPNASLDPGTPRPVTAPQEDTGASLTCDPHQLHTPPHHRLGDVGPREQTPLGLSHSWGAGGAGKRGLGAAGGQAAPHTVGTRRPPSAPSTRLALPDEPSPPPPHGWHDCPRQVPGRTGQLPPCRQNTVTRTARGRGPAPRAPAPQQGLPRGEAASCRGACLPSACLFVPEHKEPRPPAPGQTQSVCVSEASGQPWAGVEEPALPPPPPSGERQNRHLPLHHPVTAQESGALWRQ